MKEKQIGKRDIMGSSTPAGVGLKPWVLVGSAVAGRMNVVGHTVKEEHGRHYILFYTSYISHMIYIVLYIYIYICVLYIICSLPPL